MSTFCAIVTPRYKNVFTKFFLDLKELYWYSTDVNVFTTNRQELEYGLTFVIRKGK